MVSFSWNQTLKTLIKITPFLVLFWSQHVRPTYSLDLLPVRVSYDLLHYHILHHMSFELFTPKNLLSLE
jgi:hypothetical protein